MSWITKWLMPVAFWVAGISLLMGWTGGALTLDPTLRATLGLVVILFGVQRFVAARTGKAAPRRRYGGSARRPWES